MATYDKPNCPQCGKPARGTLERLEACAEFVRDESGRVDFSGYTEVFFDSALTVRRRGRVVLLCHCGHDWTARELPEPEAPAPALQFRATEFCGNGDPMFGGTADDRPLCKDGSFKRHAAEADIAVFATEADALAAAEAAPNKRRGGKIGAYRSRQ